MRRELLAKLEKEAAAWDSGSGDVAALLREAKADIEHLAGADASHFEQAMLNGEKANDLRKDAQRYRWLIERLIAYDYKGPALVFFLWPDGAALRFDDIDGSISAAMVVAPGIGAA